MYSPFGKSLKKIMIDNDLKNTTAAKQLGISPQKLANYLSGKCYVPSEFVSTVSKKMKLTPEQSQELRDLQKNQPRPSRGGRRGKGSRSEFSRQLKKHMDTKQITVTDLARRIGVTYCFVSNVLNDIRGVSRKNLAKTADVLGLTSHEIVELAELNYKARAVRKKQAVLKQQAFVKQHSQKDTLDDKTRKINRLVSSLPQNQQEFARNFLDTSASSIDELDDMFVNVTKLLQGQL